MNTSEEPLDLPADAAPSPGRIGGLARRWPVLVLLVAILLLAGGAALVASLASRGSRPLYPNLPTFTPVAQVVTSEPTLLTFAQLNADPNAYRDQRIQVSGDYASVAPPTCVPIAGPRIRWSLVAEDLQLNAVGFENVLRLVSEGTPMTVAGIWRLYGGPVGCGKQPPTANVWYLQVDQIIEPNPLFGVGPGALTVVAGSPLPTLPPLDLSVPTQTATPTLPATETISAIEAVTATPTLSLLVTTTVNATTTTTTTTPAATVSGTPPLSGTPEATSTPGPSPTPSPTLTGGETETPGIPTATLSGTGYPPPTATTNPYP